MLAQVAQQGAEDFTPDHCRNNPLCHSAVYHYPLFHNLKGYRALATRYDKLAAMFLGGVLAALLAISLKCIVNTP